VTAPGPEVLLSSADLPTPHPYRAAARAGGTLGPPHITAGHTPPRHRCRAGWGGWGAAEPGVRVCRAKPAQGEGVEVSASEGLANHAGPESCAKPGNGVRDALTGERAGRVLSPAIGLVPGADALRTRGRPQRGCHHGKASPHPAGSKPAGMHGNLGGGTREALCPAVSLAARLAWCTTGTRP
jgi:hypothetical protein